MAISVGVFIHNTMIMSVKNETIQFIEYHGKKYTSRSVLSDDIGYDGKTELTLASESLWSDLWCNDENGDLQFIDKEAELLDERIFGYLSENELSQTYDNLCKTCRNIFS